MSLRQRLRTHVGTRRRRHCERSSKYPANVLWSEGGATLIIAASALEGTRYRAKSSRPRSTSLHSAVPDAMLSQASTLPPSTRGYLGLLGRARKARRSHRLAARARDDLRNREPFEADVAAQLVLVRAAVGRHCSRGVRRVVGDWCAR